MENEGIYFLSNWANVESGGNIFITMWNVFKHISIHHYLVVAAIIFTIGFAIAALTVALIRPDKYKEEFAEA